MMKGLFRTKEVSVALGSGSAKGVSHIGVIEALEVAGFKISAASGTSMGAIVAAYYGLGKLDVLKDWFLSFDKMETFRNIDFSLTGGLISGKKLMATFEDHLGGATFEDSRIPLYIPATNLDMGRAEIFSKGPVLPAIRASISVPGMLKPYRYGGYYYVDGAVTDPVPVDILIKNGFKNVVAVHLNEYLEERRQAVSPGMIDTMARSMSIVSKYLAKAKMGGAAAIIEPNLAGVGMFHVYKARDIIEMGRKAAEKIIESGVLDGGLSHIVKNISRILSHKTQKDDPL